jgi:putative Mn2+ efflux pump MntP
MDALLFGGLALSLFHALIPSHWLPVVAISRQNRWTARQTLGVTFLIGLFHVLSTVLIGLLLALVGEWISGRLKTFTHWIAPALLIALGIFYLYQHHRHHHFHLHAQQMRWGVVGTLAAAMFFSPCLEIEGYFLAAGQHGWAFVGLLALLYAVVTIVGMLIWVWLALHGLKRLDWHAWEHNAGLITGLTLIASGIALLFLE